MTKSDLVAALAPVTKELHRIATILESFVPETETQEETPCLHPMETRADFGTTDGQEDWLCRVCGYRSRTPS